MVRLDFPAARFFIGKKKTHQLRRLCSFTCVAAYKLSVYASLWFVPLRKKQYTNQTPTGALAEQKKKTRISWARLLKRIFGIDIETCNLCGGKVKIISAIEDPKVIKKILDHVGMPSVAPAPKPARGPPQVETNQDEFDFHQQSPEEI